MADITRDPYKNFNYLLELNGTTVAGFSLASIPDSSGVNQEMREGTDAPYSRKLSTGPVKYGNLTLKRGVSNSMELNKWSNAVNANGADAERKTINLILKNENGETVEQWIGLNAWPSAFLSSGLSPDGNNVMIESLELQMERLERVE